jgi:cellulase/cellobiase CelA1
MAYPEYPSNVVTALVPGIPIIMAQTTVYALPARACTILSSNTNVQISPDGVVAFQTIANATTGTVIAGGGAIRSIGSTATVILQKV